LYRSRLVILFIIVLIACNPAGRKDTRPNIVLIVADDLGYGDIGCYGGDIETPHLDTLAKHGIRFSRFHTAPMCAPTRAMLLSGNDNHLAGMGEQGAVSEVFGYEGRLTERIIPFPALLRDAGYHTYMAGKWHLGLTPETNPHRKGFERSFALLNGAGNHYSNRSALRRGYSDYTEDGDSTGWEDGVYSTAFYTDKLMEYIGQNLGDGKPFFAFAAYTSPHWPLQVDKEYWYKYKGRYDDGYEKLREQRLSTLKKEGMIPEDASLPAIHQSVVPWDSLTGEEQMMEARKMELYAGMVDNLDHHIGRLVQYLTDEGVYENTLFVFMSDNGAAYRDFINNSDYQFLREYFDDDYENMGNADSYISYGPQWAEAGSAPFRYFKDYATEGGTNTTLVISGPGVSGKGEIHHGFTTLLDLAPTFYELAGTGYPDVYEGHEVYPLKGTSLVPFLTGKTGVIHDDRYVFAIEHYGNAMVRKGHWKITNYIHPFDMENFALYDLSRELGEQHDLKEEEPGKYAEMLAEWKKYAAEIKLPTQSGGPR
jgi:arylsulfatase A-like enzyme